MAQLTMLAEMMSPDLEEAVDRLQELGIRQLDLKNHVFDRAIDDLDDARRERLAALVARRGLEVYCFSSELGHVNVSRISEAEFNERLERGIANMLATAKIVRPRMIRLLSCDFDGRPDWPDSNQYLERQAPWVFAAYRRAVARINAAGIEATIENEPNTNLSTPAEVTGFFARLDAVAGVGYTWDVQNMWQSGVYPTLAVYRALQPLINYVHLKGGAGTAAAPEVMTFRAPLAEAGWPVREIVAQVLADKVSPTICLNPSHGAPPPDYHLAAAGDRQDLVRAEAREDAAFLREAFEELR